MYNLMLSLIVIITVVAFTVAVNDKPYYNLKNAERLFTNFQHEFNRHYENEEERQRHFECFVVNLIKINYLNSNQDDPDVYDINQFADHTIKDKHYLLGYLADAYKNHLTSSQQNW